MKKIVTISEWQQVMKDLREYFPEEKDQFHEFDMKYNIDLMTKSLSHESILIWNIHVWAHFNGQKWDGVFIGAIRKSEKYGKKFMDEYLWLATDSNKGCSLYKMGEKYAKEQSCDFITMNVTNRFPKSEKIKKFYLKIGFKKDSETFLKKL